MPSTTMVNLFPKYDLNGNSKRNIWSLSCRHCLHLQVWMCIPYGFERRGSFRSISGKYLLPPFSCRPAQTAHLRRSLVKIETRHQVYQIWNSMQKKKIGLLQSPSFSIFAGRAIIVRFFSRIEKRVNVACHARASGCR